jgi:pyridoxamine 5'-phosphate oxidase
LFLQLRERARDLGLNVSDDLQSIESGDRAVIPRPGHWGGVRIWASAVELWIEGQDRIHDRARWQRSLDRDATPDFVAGDWKGTRLQP